MKLCIFIFPCDVINLIKRLKEVKLAFARSISQVRGSIELGYHVRYSPGERGLKGGEVGKVRHLLELIY